MCHGLGQLLMGSVITGIFKPRHSVNTVLKYVISLLLEGSEVLQLKAQVLEYENSH